MKMQVIKLNSKSKTQSSVSASDYVWSVDHNSSVLHQSIVAYLANKRHGTHDTKTRAEVIYSTRKIRAQKGTGNARLGSRRSPTLIGGGVAHGPHPRSYRQKLPKKMKRLALRVSLSDKVRSKNLFVLDKMVFTTINISNIKSLINGLDIKGSVLIITENTDHNIIKSARNLHGVEVIPAALLNALDISMKENILTTKDVIKKIDLIWGEG